VRNDLAGVRTCKGRFEKLRYTVGSELSKLALEHFKDTWSHLRMSSVVSVAPREDNKLRIEDRAAHDWYRFVLSYPAHLVRDYISRFEVGPDGLVLDPFCGTGTTLVECKKLGIRSVGIESNPIASFASQVKVDWSVDPNMQITSPIEPGKS
jgi:hypothetical protein